MKQCRDCEHFRYPEKNWDGKAITWYCPYSSLVGFRTEEMPTCSHYKKAEQQTLVL